MSPRSRRPKKMSNPFDNEDLSFRCLSFPFKSLAVLSDEKGRTLFSRVSASLGARFFFSGRGLALFLRESAAESFGFLFVRGVNDDKSVMRRSSVDVSSKTTSIIKERREEEEGKRNDGGVFSDLLKRWYGHIE